jgi:hypothetical protein
MEGEKKYSTTLSLTIVLDGEGCHGCAPAALTAGKRPDLHCGLRHECIITVWGIVFTLTLWRGIVQHMKVCLLEE